MLLQAAINGARTRADHPAVPLTPREQAADAAASVAAGAGAIHVHVRDAEGRESLAAEDVARCLDAMRESCPGIGIGVSTGAWISDRRDSLVRSWTVLPDFASVNVHEDGALDLMRLLLDRGIGVEAGVWSAAAARTLMESDLVDRCLRILLEPAEDGADAMDTLEAIEAALAGAATPKLLHGFDSWAWPFLTLAPFLGYDARIGLEDTTRQPNGSPAANNAQLVAAARAIIANAVRL